MDLECADNNVNDEMIEQNLALRRQEREAELIASKLGSISETGQGLRCSVLSCGKLFRKEKLLRQHVKHYHPKEYKEIIQSSKIQCDHESEMRPPKSSSNFWNDSLTFDKKRKFSQSHLDLNNENKRQKRNSIGLHSQLSADEDELEIDSPSPLSHMNSLTATRKRNDSMLSASSGVSDGDNLNDKLISPIEVQSSLTWSGNNYSKQKGRLNPLSPSTPPTFRFSRRRQAQLRANRRNDLRTSPRETNDSGSSKTAKNFDESVLANSMSPKVALTILDDSMLTSPALRLSEQQLSPAAGYSQANSTSIALNATGQSSYPPSEMDVLSVTGSEHLTTEELVNCSCRRLEEDGLMIQCDICLCWQHGSCLAIEEEDQVPEYYVCETCRNPRLGRTSAKYSVDQDWLNKGILPTVIPSRLSQQEESGVNANSNVQSSFLNNSKQSLLEKDTAFRKLSELMADLANLSKLLHSLRVKLHIASQSNNSKVFMWSSLWDQPSKLVASQPKTEKSQLSSNLNNPHNNTGEMLTTDEHPAVNLSQDGISENINSISPTTSLNLKTEENPPETVSSGDNPEDNMAASTNVFKVDNDLLNISHDMNKTKNDSSKPTGQTLLPCAKMDNSSMNANTSQNGLSNVGSSTYPCLTESNTLLSQPQAQLRPMDVMNLENKSCDPKPYSEENSINGKLDKESSPSEGLSDSHNVHEKPHNCVDADHNKSSDPTEELKHAATKIAQDANFKIPATLGPIVNGQLCTKLTEDKTCEDSSRIIQTSLAELNKTNNVLLNGNISDNCKGDENTFSASKKNPLQLAISNNKENEPDVGPILNGENHLMAEINSIHTNNGEASKNIALAMDIKSVEQSTNSQTVLDKSVSKPSEPQINGLLEKTSSETSQDSVNVTDISGLMLANKEECVPAQQNGDRDEMCANDTSSTNECASSDKTLEENNFMEPQHDVLLDENQEVDPSMIPSLSEVQQLLPSLMSSLEEQLLNDQQQVQLDSTLDESACINSLSSDVNNIASIDVGNQSLQQFHTPIIPATPVAFPETKRIDKDECRLNLMHHIDAVQTEFERRLNLVEATIAEIDFSKTGTNPSPTPNDTDEDTDPAAKTKAILTLLLHDLRTSKNLVSLG